MSRRHAFLVLRIVVTAAALGWTLSRVPMDDMILAVRRLTWVSVGTATGILLVNLWVVGALRWRILLHAYGGRDVPQLATLAKLNWVGTFYNTFLPGNVGGDFLRARATRKSFANAASSFMIIAIERVFGLAGLLLLGALVLLLHPIKGVHGLSWISVLGVLAAGTASISPLIGRALSRYLPGRLRTLAESLPSIARPTDLPFVLLFSLGTQTLVALTGHVIMATLAPQVTLFDSLVLIPLSTIAAYFPATVAGLGVREAAFVLLFSAIGVSKADATAASLTFMFVQLIVAAAGGIAHVATGTQGPASSVESEVDAT